MLVQNKYTSCMSNFCILNFLNNYTTYSRYLRKPTFFELSIPLKRSPSTKTEFFFFSLRFNAKIWRNLEARVAELAAETAPLPILRDPYYPYFHDNRHLDQTRIRSSITFTNSRAMFPFWVKYFLQWG